MYYFYSLNLRMNSFWGDRIMPVAENSYSRVSELSRRSFWHSLKALKMVYLVNGLNMRVVAPDFSVPTQVESLDSDFFLGKL